MDFQVDTFVLYTYLNQQKASNFEADRPNASEQKPPKLLEDLNIFPPIFGSDSLIYSSSSYQNLKAIAFKKPPENLGRISKSALFGCAENFAVYWLGHRKKYEKKKIMKFFELFLFAMFYVIVLWSLKSIWAILRELLIFLFLVY